MAVTVKNNSGSQFGVETAETGVEVESIDVRYYPEYKERFLSRLNQTTGFAVPDKLSIAIQIEAKVKGNTGLMGFTHTAAVTIGNDTTTFQLTPGGIYMDEVTEKQSYNGWRMISMALTADPECA